MDRVRGMSKASAGVTAALVLVVTPDAATAASRERAPVGRYVGQTTQRFPVSFDFVTKKGILPQLDPSGPAVYDVAAMTRFRCNRGGNVQRRVFFAAAITNATGAFAETGSGTTPVRGESQTFSLRGRLFPNGRASGSFEQTITNFGNAKGRVCSTGTVGWTAKLRRK